MNQAYLNKLKHITNLSFEIQKLKKSILEAGMELEQVKLEVQEKVELEKQKTLHNKIVYKKKVKRKQEIDQLREQEKKIRESLIQRIDQLINQWLEENNLKESNVLLKKNILKLDNTVIEKSKKGNSQITIQEQNDTIMIGDKIYDLNIDNLKNNIKEKLLKKMLNN